MPRKDLLLFRIALTFAIAWLLASPVSGQPLAPSEPTPIVIGQSWRLDSAVLGQTREINVWLPPGYEESDQTYPVLFLLDGGIDQDFHHISGLAQLGTVNGTTGDVIVIGIATVDRRNELALPTETPELIARYPTQGQSQRFRDFIRSEVQPWVTATFRTNGHGALMGESLAGLFVVETLLAEPEMFDAYVAVSPSLWWDGGALADRADELLAEHMGSSRRLFLFLGDEGPEMQTPMDVLVQTLTDEGVAGLDWTYESRPEESHATIYHRAALDAFRRLYPAEIAP